MNLIKCYCSSGKFRPIRQATVITCSRDRSLHDTPAGRKPPVLQSYPRGLRRPRMTVPGVAEDEHLHVRRGMEPGDCSTGKSIYCSCGGFVFASQLSQWLLGLQEHMVHKHTCRQTLIYIKIIRKEGRREGGLELVS